MHAIYNDQTGAFLGSFTCSPINLEANLKSLPEGQGAIEYFETPDSELYYCDLANSVLMRPMIEAEIDKLELQADGEDSILITGLPIPCTITVDEEVFELTDPSDPDFEFSTDAKGSYIIKVECFPYVTKVWEVEAI